MLCAPRFLVETTENRKAWRPKWAALRLVSEQNRKATSLYFVFFLTLTHRYNAVHGHRTGSNDSGGVEDHLRRKVKVKILDNYTIIETNYIPHTKNMKVRSYEICLLYTSPSPRDRQKSRMPSSA